MSRNWMPQNAFPAGVPLASTNPALAAIAATLGSLRAAGASSGPQLAGSTRWRWQGAAPEFFPAVPAADGGVWVPEPGTDGIMPLTWWGVVGDGVADDQAALSRWCKYAEERGGKFALLPGQQVRGHVRLENPRRAVHLLGYGATLTGPDPEKPVIYIDDQEKAGGSIGGLTVSHVLASYGPPLSGVVGGEPRRTIGGHGIAIRYGQGWAVTGCTVRHVSAMAILFFNVTRYSATGNTVENVMADGIHSTRGCRQGTITGNNLYNTGDDALATISDKTWHGQQPRGVDPNSAAPMCQDIAITGNTVDGSGARGIVVSGGRRITISGNIVQNTYRQALYIYKAATFLNHSGIEEESHPVQACVVDGGVYHLAGRYRGGPEEDLPAVVQVEGQVFDVALGGAMDIAYGRSYGLALLSPGVRVGRDVVIHDNDGSGVLVQEPGCSVGAIVRNNGRFGVESRATEGVTTLTGELRSNAGEGLMTYTAGHEVSVMGATIADNGHTPMVYPGEKEARQAPAQITHGAGVLTLHAARIRGTRAVGLLNYAQATALACDLRGAGTTPIQTQTGGSTTAKGNLGAADIPAT